MSLKYFAVLFAALSMLVPLGANATVGGVRQASAGGSAFAYPGKNGSVYVKYDFVGNSNEGVRMYLIGLTKYFTLTKDTSQYSVLKHDIRVHQPGGDVVIKAGTKWWSRIGLHPYTGYQPHVRIAVRVRNDIPKKLQQCIRTSWIFFVRGDPSKDKFGPAGPGTCMPGQAWLDTQAGK